MCEASYRRVLAGLVEGSSLGIPGSWPWSQQVFGKLLPGAVPKPLLQRGRRTEAANMWKVLVSSRDLIQKQPVGIHRAKEHPSFYPIMQDSAVGPCAVEQLFIQQQAQSKKQRLNRSEFESGSAWDRALCQCEPQLHHP